MKILAFIPARGGSKGIKNKNISIINKKPLINYTLTLAKKLKNIDLFVSTNDKKIFNVARKNGFKFNYLRPNKLSGPKSNVVDAVFDGLNWLEINHNKKFDAILLLQPTSPIRKIDDIKKAVKLFTSKKINSLASVTQMREHPEECVEISKNNYWKFLKRKKGNNYGRQSFSKNFFFIDGNFYLIKKDFLFRKKKFIVENQTVFYKLKTKWPIDIDELEDLKVAEQLIKLKIN